MRNKIFVTEGFTFDLQRFAEDLSGFSHNGNTYYIYTAQELVTLAIYINNSGASTKGFMFKLMNDIDMSDVESFPTIGDTYKAFEGSFDGQNHTISNMKINRSGASSVGLFGFVNGSNTSIKNLTLDNARVYGKAEVGGLVGTNSGCTIENCHITNSLIIGDTHNLNEASYGYLGGLVGFNGSDSTVKNCTASNIYVTGDSYVAGLVGGNKGKIDSCSVTNGTVISNSVDRALPFCHIFQGTVLTGDNSSSDVTCYCDWPYKYKVENGYWLCDFSNKTDADTYIVTVTRYPGSSTTGALPDIDFLARKWDNVAWNRIKTLVVGEGVTSFNRGDFGILTDVLENIDLSESNVTAISDYTFINMVNLKTISLPTSVKTSRCVRGLHGLNFA